MSLQFAGQKYQLGCTCSRHELLHQFMLCFYQIRLSFNRIFGIKRPLKDFIRLLEWLVAQISAV